MIPRFPRRAALAVVLTGTLLALGERGDTAPRCYIVGRYQIVGDTVFDGSTGLTWQQTVSPQMLSWTDAGTYCTTQAGGFRLPTMKELLSIVDYTKPMSTTVPTINPIAFPNTPALPYWSSSILAGGGGAWTVYFNYGSAFANPMINPALVRCVR